MRAVIVLVLAMAILPGCQQKWLATYQPNHPAPLAKAPVEGQYNLYVRGNKVPVECALLRQGAPIGFHKDAAGTLFAIAGGDRWMLPEAKYHWQTVPPPETNLEILRDLAIPIFVAMAVFGVAVVLLDSITHGSDFSDWGSDSANDDQGTRHHHGH